MYVRIFASRCGSSVGNWALMIRSILSTGNSGWTVYQYQKMVETDKWYPTLITMWTWGSPCFWNSIIFVYQGAEAGFQDGNQSLNPYLEHSSNNHWNVVCLLPFSKSALDFRPVWVTRHGYEQRGGPKCSGKRKTIC